MKRIKVFFLGLLLALGMLMPNAVYGQEQGAGEAAGYSIMKVEPEVPQVNKESSFYDLLVEPGSEFTIQAELTNGSTEEAKIKTAAYTTFTNSNGEINYTAEPEKDQVDKSLKIPFASIAEIEGENPIVLAGEEKKTVSMKIRVPQDAQEGVILGSWYFEKENQPSSSSEEKSGINIENKFAYSLAVKLTVQKEINQPHLELLDVKPALNNYRKVINARVQNDQAAVVSKLNFHGKVTKKGSDDILFEGKMDDRIMAPNSNFQFPIFLDKQQLKAGDYTLHLTATTKDTKWEEETWKWTKDFTVTNEEANKLNEDAINDPEPEKNYLVWILSAIIGLLLLLLLILFFKRKKDDKDEEDKKE